MEYLYFLVSSSCGLYRKYSYNLNQATRTMAAVPKEQAIDKHPRWRKKNVTSVIVNMTWILTTSLAMVSTSNLQHIFPNLNVCLIVSRFWNV